MVIASSLSEPDDEHLMEIVSQRKDRASLGKMGDSDLKAEEWMIAQKIW